MRTSIALAFLVVASSARAQNCANTSTGLVPLPVLGAGSYQGFQGGLYPGGSNARPLQHTVDGMAQATAVVPRGASGAPDAAGKIVFLSIGMSNCTQEFSRFLQLANADALKSPRVQCVDGAQGGQTAFAIQDPAAPFWTVVDQRLAAANATREQVQVIWFKEADAGPTSGFPAYAQTLRTEFTAIMQVIHDRFPNARIAYLASRIYAGYATTMLNPEPYAYEQGFACKWLIEDQIAGAAALEFDAARGPVESPWIDWGTYNWADGLAPNPDGLTWACADLQADGTHPSNSGRDKVAQRLLAFVRTDPIAASWYLRQAAPSAYGTGKLTSIGSLPSATWSGTPSLTANDFVFRTTGGIPNAPGMAFFGALPDVVPFVNASRYVAAPVTRLPIQLLDAAGAGAFPIAIVPAMVGTTRFYQGYLRNAAHPDGTGAVVTDGLRVVFGG